ncbi:MFS transporter [Amycolatopsis sp. NBC_01480]|uniref:MFS transporter n=1 Tax=Amycolatopsis sp. NBC_01480 TaxID=2903562 RepID=UPI002E288018|nr:MFS transporter [Amycolatopsis sp. NBC_01480]
MTTRIRPTSVGTMLTAMVSVEVCSGVVQGYLPPLLPALGLDLHIDTTGQNNVYLLSQLAAAVLTPLLSRLGDLYGHRRLLRWCLALVAAGSLLMAAVPSSATLMAGVAMQGAVVGFLPLLIAILRSRAPRHNRFGIGLLVGGLLVAIGLGGLVAGVLSESHAEAGLWVAVPVACLAMVAGLVVPDSDTERGGRFNAGAAVLLTGALIGIVLAVAQGPEWGWGSPAALGTAAGGGVLLALWMIVEARSAHPLVDVRMFANRRLAVVCATTFCVSFGTIGFLGANATFLGTSTVDTGYGAGLGPQTIAMISLAMVLTGFAGSTLTRRLAGRLGDRAVLITAGVLAVAGFALLCVLHDSLGEYLIGALTVGFADGLTEAITRTLSVEAVATEDTALAAGLNELSLSIGAAIGSAVIGALFAAHPLEHTGDVELSGYLWSWGTCAALAAAGVAVALGYRSARCTDDAVPAAPPLT